MEVVVRIGLIGRWKCRWRVVEVVEGVDVAMAGSYLDGVTQSAGRHTRGASHGYLFGAVYFLWGRSGLFYMIGRACSPATK